MSLLQAGATGIQSFRNVQMNQKAGLDMGLPTPAASQQNNLIPVSE